MTEKLQKIVSEAYTLFKKYKVSRPLDVCTDCCVIAQEENQLATLSVRFIPQELLETWNIAAKANEPDLAEFKHFLPRFLDLITQYKFTSYCTELSLKSFGYYSEKDWTKKERN